MILVGPGSECGTDHAVVDQSSAYKVRYGDRGTSVPRRLELNPIFPVIHGAQPLSGITIYRITNVALRRSKDGF
jgi:hypothetical protein